MEKTIAMQNAERLATLTTLFILVNGLEDAPRELGRILALAISANLAEWYEKNGKTYAPDKELIEDEAIKYAFARVQEINDRAQMEAAMLSVFPSLNGGLKN